MRESGDAQAELRRQAAADRRAPDVRDGQGPHGSQGTRRTKGLSEAQIVQWERGRGLLYRTELASRALDVKPE
jgi:hypothetical protein